MIYDLPAFLHKCLDEDEQVARVAADECDGPEWTAYSASVDTASGSSAAIGAWGYFGEQRHHMARHDPARVLAEVAAKRQIIEAHDFREPMEDSPTLGPAPAAEIAYCPICQVSDCLTLRLLALPYAGHPDYQPEWAPAE